MPVKEHAHGVGAFITGRHQGNIAAEGYVQTCHHQLLQVCAQAAREGVERSGHGARACKARTHDTGHLWLNGKACHASKSS